MITDIPSTVSTLTLDAGRPCLDFANTADWHASSEPVECLRGYDDLVIWAWRADILDEAKARQLIDQARHQPAAAAAVLAQAVELREALYRIFSAAAAGASAVPADLALLNRRLPEALARLRLTPAGSGYSWQWQVSEAELDQMLWPLIRSAADLLASPELAQVKQCQDDRGCGFLFLDTSRNRSRRWCSMRGCGNRAKVRRFRRRHEDYASSSRSS
jgi:predicted RNA-binding Zn ribbon-like protein